MNHPHALFVTGTDTDVGKTYYSCHHLAQLTAAGLHCCAFKPVGSGAMLKAGRWVHDDAEQLLNSCQNQQTLDEVNPFVYPDPVSPHIAALLAHQTPPTVEQIKQHYQTILSRHRPQHLLVEGAGGITAPINERETMCDLVSMLNIPVVIVVAMRLGCLNHAQLTHDYLKQRNLPIHGWVANEIAPNMPSLEQNLATLKRMLGEPMQFLEYKPND